MNSIVVTSTKQNIKFGYEGEDNVTKIIFPYDESWLEYGEGNFEVRILRCGDEVAYTATEIVDDRQAMTLTMTVTDIELSVRGRGEMQLCYVCPDCIKKSPIYQYTVNRSVDYKYAVDPPDGSIIASVEKSLSEIKNTTNRLSNSVISIESSIESINGRINTAEGNINENAESISNLNESVTELENRKVTDLETSGGKSDSGKYLTVGTDGKVKATSLTIPTITVDASLSTTSKNPVQNKVIKTELNNINSNIETCNTEISKLNGSLGDVKADLDDVTDLLPMLLKTEESGSSISVTDEKIYNCYLRGSSDSIYDATALIDGVNIKVTDLNGQSGSVNKFMIRAGQIDKAVGDLFVMDRLRTAGTEDYEHANGRNNSSAIELSLFNTRCAYSVNAVNEYLSENPIRIWYQTPDFDSANKFHEYIICTGDDSYSVIGTLDAIDPLNENDYINVAEKTLVRGSSETPISLSGGIKSIPENVVLSGSGNIAIFTLDNIAEMSEQFVSKHGWNEINPENTTFFDNVNYFDKDGDSFINGKYVNFSGVVIKSANTCSLIMRVKPNTQYVLYVPDNNRGIIVSSKSKTFVTGITYPVLYKGGQKATGYPFETGNNDHYIFAYVYSGTYDYEANKNSIRLVEGNSLSPYDKPTIKPENLPQDIVSAASPIHGKNVLIFGDSITDTCNFTIDSSDQTTTVVWKNPSNSYTPPGGSTIYYNMWPKILKDMGICSEIRNYARSGASYKTSATSEGEERQNLEYQITVALNDLSNPNGAFEVDDFVPDIVIFALGTNDGTPNDTYDSAMSKTVLSSDGYSIDTAATLANLDTSKFCEAARSAFLRTRIAFPYAQFYCVLPIQRANNEINGENLNTYLRQMARRYGCIIVDGYAESGIIRDTNVWNSNGFTLKDGLHPNDKGQNMMFRMIYSALKSNYITSSAMNP